MEHSLDGHPRHLHVLRVSIALLAAAWLTFLLSTVTGAGSDLTLLGKPVTDWLYAGLLLGAGLLCLARAIVDRPERPVWTAFAIGLTLWSFGDIWWLTFLADGGAPYPSIADALWLSSYVPMAYGVWRLISLRVGWQALGTAAWLDSAIAALTGSALFAATVLAGPIAVALQGEPTVFATNLAYPIGDLLLLGSVLAALSAMGWRPGRAIGLIAAGLLLRAVADFVYLDQVTLGTYAGGLLDTTWPAASLLVAAAACVSTRGARRDPDWRTFIAPASCVALSLALLVIDHFSRLPSTAVILAGVAIALAAARLGAMVRTTLAINERRALTDPLTGLSNRRALTRDLARAIEDSRGGQRFVFALFDLDGFKRYNDSFGHPTGDALLARLGARLAKAAEPGGCYRIGGDEFCVLLHDRGDAEQGLARASAALTERGEGFQITATHGSVSIPGETTDPELAMQLADRRMYAAKLGGRGAGDDSVELLLGALREAKPGLEAHLGSVAELARDVARRLDLSPEEVDEVVRAAKLHDIGKMAIPDEILDKSGPLDEAEWEFMRKHSLIGERIVSAAPPLLPVAKLIRSSHERWDGKGYPDGLLAEAIPRGARIVFACDSFDAMTSPRPYNAPCSTERALAELVRCSGRQFDPDVVDAVVSAVRARSAATRATGDRACR